jgi:hypothetical protein
MGHPLAGLFDGEVSAFPLPPEIPPEVPRLQLKSKDEKCSFTATQGRITVAMSSKTPSDQIPSDFVKTFTRVLEACLTGDIPFTRLALVINRAAIAEGAPQQLIDRFCRPEIADENSPILRHSLSFQLHNLKKYSAGGFLINSWVRCKTGHYTTPQKSPVIVVEQDLNIAEESPAPVLPPDRIADFFKMAETEAKTILDLYFPDKP